jgi:hypothetical protein
LVAIWTKRKEGHGLERTGELWMAESMSATPGTVEAKVAGTDIEVNILPFVKVTMSKLGNCAGSIKA